MTERGTKLYNSHYMGFNHTTVIYGGRAVERRRAEDEAFRARSDALLDVALNNRVVYPVRPVALPAKRPSIPPAIERRRWDANLVRSFGL